MAVAPYQIAVADSKIDRLNDLLDDPEWTDDVVSNDQWKYGAPLSDVKRIAHHWRHNYDWRAAEKRLNELPQFKTIVQVDGFDPLDIHFIHQKSDIPGAIPLLFVHGWPGSFIEVTKMLPLLKGFGGNPAFDVVAPSLPNFGFSSKVLRGGFGMEQYADCMHKLMIQLGYNEYVTQGGDWGTMITRTIGALYPDHCKASHINMIVTSGAPKWKKAPLAALQHAVIPHTDAEKRGLQRSEWFMKEGSGYRFEQQTKPLTLGYGLAASPVFLLAWIYEKLHDWTDSYPWTDDEVCTWLSIYWFSTAGPQASVRIYYEVSHVPTPILMKVTGLPNREASTGYIPKVPLGLAFFPKELRVVPESWTKTLGPVVYRGHHPSGGHFAAWERPQFVVNDLRAMFKKGGPCFGVVEGRNGYISKFKPKL